MLKLMMNEWNEMLVVNEYQVWEMVNDEWWILLTRLGQEVC
jgi:hypothetical protein